MNTFWLNGVETTAKEANLLDFLREDENLTSVKNGCGEGACGACMVLVDGLAKRACLLKTSQVVGKKVTTLEGLSDYEKQVYSYCFASCGAVQCGFCIPGMIISAKALLDVNKEPNDSEIKIAIKGNICRCTGYVKIEQAILKAAEMFRNSVSVPADEISPNIGNDFLRIDASDKTLGIGLYVDDMKFENMVYGRALRSKHPRAKVVSIDISKAKEVSGVVAVLTADDIDGKRFLGHLVKDWPALVAIGEETRYVGDSIALVAAETKEALSEALGQIEVVYEVLQPITNPLEAQNDPKQILRKEVLTRGDVDTAIKNSKHVVTYKYSTPFTEHAFLEPESAIAIPENGGVKLYTGGQSVYDEQHEIMDLLNLPEDKVRVISAYVGGGFGGKEDMSVQHHAALLAHKTGRIVKVTFSREESIKIHPKLHAAEMEFTTACDADGNLTAMRATIIMDTGAYASLGGPVLQRACTHAAGPYNYHNIDITGIAVYTNNPPGGAFRGFGVTQSAFATECNINRLAELCGLSPWEFRYKNAIRPKQVLPNGQIADESTALVETLEAVKEFYESQKFAGIACALKNAGLGVGVPDAGRCKIKIVDGKAHIRTSAACIGQGMGTILLQIFCETTGISKNNVVYTMPDTSLTPNSGTTTASRQTVFTGEACKLASEKLKQALEKNSLGELDGQEFYGEFFPKTDPMGTDKENPVSHVAYGYATQVVALDEFGKLIAVHAAHDVGRAINPIAVEGQIEGGVVMGLGYALTENYPLTVGVPTAKFGTLGLFRSTAVPEIKSIIIEKNLGESLAYGAKGVGEITTIPTAAAVQGAYYKLDGTFRQTLPLPNTFYRKQK